MSEGFLDFIERGEGLLEKDKCYWKQNILMIYLETGVSVVNDICLSIILLWAKADNEYFLE